MGSGPEAGEGYDLKMTELDDCFLIRIGSDIGLAVMQDLDWEPATAFCQQAAQRGLEHAVRSMGRQIRDIESVPDAILNNLEHEYWMDVSARCMSCGNCTFVCPTCFCWDAVDEVSVTTKETSRYRVWDSCFNLAYSAQAGGNTRPSTKSRYRQWLSHKFGNWQKQFDVLGCVGCGRCITWCPAGIDVTAEVQSLPGGVLMRPEVPVTAIAHQPDQLLSPDWANVVEDHPRGRRYCDLLAGT